jgi:hypothetical protein
MFSTELFQRRRELLKQLASKQYEVTPAGVYFEKTQALVGGSIVHWQNGADMRVDHNTFTIEGLNYLFDTGFNRSAAATAFYVAPFSGNVTPASTLTAATYVATLTEATAYDESARPEYVDIAAASGSVTNTASRAEITANAAVTIWGAGLLSVATKSSGSGVCLAAAKFASSRVLADNDVLAFDYTLTLTPA